MAWPLSQDYNEAIQSPASCLADPELKAGNPATNALGIPQPRSGNFADVYEFLCPAASRWALKCFTREVKGLRERYAEISDYLQQAKLPFTVEFHYLEQGLRIRGSWYPALKMRWIEGLLLNEFVRDNLDKPARLQALSQIWLRMAKRLREAGMAHADLQHGNVILVPGSTANSLAVKLIDYDGMFVPGLAGKKSGEVGHPNYQHPQRLREGTYSAEVDRLPLLVVATALRVLAAPGGKALWQRYDNGDNLLFKETDLRAPAESALFQELRQASDPLTKKLVGALEKGCAGRLQDVPLLEELLPEEKPATKTAIKGQGGVAKTAGAVESPDWDFDREGPAPARPVRRQGKAVPAWAWAAGGAVAATLLVGGILLATRNKEPEKTPQLVRNNDQKTQPPKRGPAQVKPKPVEPPKREPVEPKPVEPPMEVVRPDPMPDPEPRPDPPPAEKGPPVSAPKPTLIARTPAAGVKVLTRPRWSVSTEAKESTTVAVHPDNKHFFYGEKDGTIRLADLGTGRVVRTLAGGHTRHVARLVVAANGKQLLSTGFDGVACIWDLQTWRIAQRFTRHTENWFVNGDLSPDGKHALTWQSYKDDSLLYVWDTSTGEVVAEAKGRKPAHIANARFFLDGRRILLARGSLLAHLPLQLWDPDKKLETRYFEGLEKTKPHFISDLALSGDGQKLLAQFGHCLALIQTRSGTPLWQVEMEMTYLARGALSSDGRLALTFGAVANGKSLDRFVPVISASRGQEVCRIAAAGYLEDGTFTPDGRQVLAMTRKELTLWDLPTREGTAVASDPVDRPKPDPAFAAAPVTGKDGLIRVLPRPSHVIALCAADAAGHRIVIDEGSEAVLWNVETGKEERRFRGHTHGITALAVSPDGSRLLSSSMDKTMRLWNLATGEELKKFEHPSQPEQVAFSHDGKYGLSGTPKPSKDEMGNDCNVHLWDLASGKKVHSFEGLFYVNRLQFSPDDRQVLALSGGSESVAWEVASKKRVTDFKAPTGPGVCALPDGKHLVMDAGNSLQLWDLTTRSKVRDFPMRGGHRPPGGVSADGRWLVTGDANPTPEDGRAVTDFSVRLWEIATGREVARFKGHSKPVHYIAISPDGSRAFSGSHDRTMRVWDLKNPGTSAVAAAPGDAPEVKPADKPPRAVKNLLFKGGINGAVGSRSFPMPRRFDITKGWELSLEAWIPDLDKTGQIFFIGDERGGKDPIFIEHSRDHLHFCVDNAFTSERQAIRVPINRTMLRKWTPMTFRYVPSAPELRVYLNHKLVARERATVTPKIDRPMRIWICSENTNNQRFFGKVRSVRLANTTMR